MAGIDFKKINKNRGKFTEKANRAGMGVQAYAKHVLANTGNYDTKTVRQASFAKAATKFKHKHGLGGWMYGDGGNPAETNGGYFSNGLTFINEGGSHEENPYEGVMMGQDNLGIPNLVEEGEIKYKIDGEDYIFSNRLKIDKSLCKAAGLPMSFAGKTYAQAFKSIQKESSERPLDGISKRGLDAYASRLKALQEEQRRLMGLQGTQNLQFDNTQLQQPQGYGQQMPYGYQPAQEPVEDTGAYADNDYYGGYGAYDDTANMSAYGGNIYSRGGNAAKRMGYTGKVKRQVKKWLDENYPDLDLRSLTDDDLALYNTLYSNASVQDRADRLVESAPGRYLQLDPAVVLDYANRDQIMEDNMSRKEKRNVRRNTKNQYLQFRSNLVDFLDKNPYATYQDFIDLMNITDTTDPNYYYSTPAKSGNEVNNDISRTLGLSLLAMSGMGSAATRRVAKNVAKEAVKPLVKSIGKKEAKSLAKSMGRAGAAMLGAEGATGLYGILGRLNPLAATAAAVLTTPELYEMAPGTDSDVKMYRFRPQMYRNKQLRQDFNSLPGVARKSLQDQYNQRFSNGNWILNAPNEFARRTGIINWVPWLINAPETVKGLTQPTVDLLPYYNQNDVDRYYKPFSDVDVDYNNNELAFGGMARKYQGPEDIVTPTVSTVPQTYSTPAVYTQESLANEFGNKNYSATNGMWNYEHNLNDEYYNQLYNPNSDYKQALLWMYNNQDNPDVIAFLNDINGRAINGNKVDWNNFYQLATDYKKGPVHDALIEFSKRENKPWLNELDPLIVYGDKTHETPDETNQEKPASYTLDTLNRLNQNALEQDQQNRQQELDQQIKQQFLDTPIKSLDFPEKNAAQNNGRKYYQTWSRYAPAFMAGLSLLNPAAYKSDYSNANIIGNTPLPYHYNNYQFAPEYQRFKPIDQNMLVNQQRSQTGATQRQIRGMSGSAPNAMAGLIAAGYNGQNQLGTNMTQSRQYNNQGRMAAVNANNQVNLSNAQLGLQSSVYNANRAATTDNARLSRNATYAKMREDIDSSNAEQFAKTLSTIGTTLGQIGHDNFLLNNNIGNYWKDKNGVTNYGAVSACGGRLRKGRKTGLKGF